MNEKATKNKRKKKRQNPKEFVALGGFIFNSIARSNFTRGIMADTNDTTFY